MFNLRTAILNIKRHRSKSILVALTCMLTVIFVYTYMDSIETNRKQLLALPQALPVTARILNGNGSQMIGLEISEGLINDIQASGLTRNLYYTAQLAANFSAVHDEVSRYKEINILCANDIHVLPNLQDKRISMTDGDTVNFLQGNDALCLADESFLQANNLAVGDSVDLALYSLMHNSYGVSFTFVPLGKCSLRIIGSVASVSVTDQVKVDILCPIGWAKDKHAEADVDFSLDSASFTVADPLNLDAFKAAMNHYNLHEVSSTAEFSVEGNSLSVEDETFIKTAGRVKNNLTVQYAFAPVIFLVIALIGYALAYLLMQGRRTDIAIMRSLGASRRVCVLIMFIEYAMLGLAGCLLGTACAAIWMKPGWSTLLIALLFLASLILGVLAATFQISKGNTMMGLIKTES